MTHCCSAANTARESFLGLVCPGTPLESLISLAAYRPSERLGGGA
jgi:hypothetical protein